MIHHVFQVKPGVHLQVAQLTLKRHFFVFGRQRQRFPGEAEQEGLGKSGYGGTYIDQAGLGRRLSLGSR